LKNLHGPQISAYRDFLSKKEIKPSVVEGGTGGSNYPIRMQILKAKAVIKLSGLQD